MAKNRLIRLYQRYLSFDTGLLRLITPEGACRFHPSCSSYCAEAVESFGLIKGSMIGLKRILRCNPFSQGGLDPVPRKVSR